jgi:hypothetical protein
MAAHAQVIPRKTDVVAVTLRRAGVRAAYALVATVLSLFAVGVPFPTQAGVAVGPVALVADGVDVPAPLPAPVEAAPAEQLPPEPPPPPAPAPAPEPEPCAAALDGVAAGGLPLPAGVDYQCPSTRFAHQGAACWDEWPCPGTAFIAINMSRLEGATPEYLRHVVAHEICHIIDFRDRGWSTEPRADACAAEYGF